MKVLHNIRKYYTLFLDNVRIDAHMDVCMYKGVRISGCDCVCVSVCACMKTIFLLLFLEFKTKFNFFEIYNISQLGNVNELLNRYNLEFHIHFGIFARCLVRIRIIKRCFSQTCECKNKLQSKEHYITSNTITHSVSLLLGIKLL